MLVSPPLLLPLLRLMLLLLMLLQANLVCCCRRRCSGSRTPALQHSLLLLTLTSQAALQQITAYTTAPLPYTINTPNHT